MPCNSDYMEPNDWEKNLREVCQHLVFVYDELPKLKKFISKETWKALKEGASSCYGKPYNGSDLSRLTATLCDVISKMSAPQLRRIVYDGRRKECRNLANWWDEHKKADKARVAKEKEKKRLNEIRRVAFNKLTNEERAAWDITYKT